MKTVHHTIQTALFFLLTAFAGAPVFSQKIFSKIENSPVVSAGGDSRSVNWIDLDGDGDQDLMITNGLEGGENNFLFRNLGSGQFERVQDDPIVMDNMPSDGATWADYDNDGDNDCFVVNWYGKDNLLYRNRGDGSFDQITDVAPVTDGGFSETASWGDFDNDGWLDLYVTNSSGTFRNYFYRNTGDGKFQKITSSPPATDAHASRCVNWTDFDKDGDADIFVTNENNQHEQLYRNEGNGTFARTTGSPLVSAAGKTMSASWGDFDNDGWQDVFLANDQGNDALFRNVGGSFTAVAGSPVTTSGGNSFGSQWADVDNDADLDLFVTNAFWGGQWRNFLFLNQGNGTFVRDQTEAPATDMGWSYGCAFGDMDNDGDLDLAVANCFNANQNDGLYENHSAENGNRWLGVALTGTVSNRSAIGAKVFVEATINGQKVVQMREISAQTGQCGQNQLPAHFGLGNASVVETLRVEWPSGLKDTFENVFPNQYLRLTEGGGLSGAVVPGDAAALPLRVLPLVPNPFEDSVQCRFELAAAADLTVEVCDWSGRVLRQLAKRTFSAGENLLVWDGRDGSGRLVAAGSYVVFFKKNEVVVGKAVVVRG